MRSEFYKIAGVILLILLSVGFVSAQDNVSTTLLFFYEAGCPHCAKVDKFLQDRIKTTYPVEINYYEVHDSQNALLLNRLVHLYDSELKTPVVFVGDTLIKGDKRESFRDIEAAVRKALRENTASPLSKLDDKTDLKYKLTIPAVVGAAAVDAVNPCAFAVLTLLLGTILVVKKSKRQVIHAGLAFTCSTYISYLLIGLGLLVAIRITGIQYYIYIGVAILAILIGLMNIKDYFWYGKWFSMDVPEAWRPKVKKITSSVTSVPGAFSVGFAVSIFLLPCSSGPYIVIIGMLSNSATRLQSIFLLILYNLIFILPFLLITFAVGYGLTTTARVEKIRQEKIKKMHLATGIIMFLIGIALIVIVLTGNI